MISKGGMNVRKPRLKHDQHKNKQGYFWLKILCICYGFVFATSHLTSSTTAHFNDELSLKGSMEIGKWQEAKAGTYHLEFLDDRLQNVEACESAMLKVKVKNNGDGDMMEPLTYEVMFAEKGDPIEQGKKLPLREGEGKVTALAKGETAELQISAKQTGAYSFLVKQQDGELVWSKKITVQCNERKTKRDENSPKATEAKEKPEQSEVESKDDKQLNSNNDVNNKSNTESDSEQQQANSPKAEQQSTKSPDALKKMEGKNR